MAKQRTGDVLRSADRLLRVLDWFSADRPAGTTGEIARDLDTSPTTIRRLLNLLESRRFVQRELSSGTYRLGFASLRLAYVAHGSNPVVRAAYDELNRLQAEYGELVVLAALDGAEFVRADTRESTFTVRVHPSFGRRLRANDGTAVGAALIAWKSKEELHELFAEDYAKENGAKQMREFERHLKKVRTQGYAVNQGAALFEGIWAVAAPIRDSDNEIVASLCVAAPANRTEPARQKTLIEETLRGAEAISKSLGWVPEVLTI